VGLVTLLTAATGATLGALAWREKHAGSRALVDSAMTQAARMTADHAAAFVRHAESTVRLAPRSSRAACSSRTTSGRSASTRSVCCA